MTIRTKNLKIKQLIVLTISIYMMQLYGDWAVTPFYSPTHLAL